MKNNNLKETLSKLLPIVLLLAGVTLAGSGLRTLLTQSGLKKTEAVIAELTDETYFSVGGREKHAQSALVSYSVDGASYTADLGGVRRSFAEGGTVEVLVDPALPERAVLPDTAGGVACAVCGGVLLIAGLIWFAPLLITVLSNKEKKKPAPASS